MAVTFFPSNPNVSAAVQAQFGANAAVDVARIRAQEAEAIARAQMAQQQQQAQQERFWRGQQMQQQDALAREQLKSTDFFNRGRLTNEEKQIAATLEANKSRDAATAAWHQAQLAPGLKKIEAQNLAEANDTAMLGAQLGNLAKVRNEYDRLTADLAKLSGLETALGEQMKLPEAPGTVSRFFKSGGPNVNALSIASRFFNKDLGSETTTGFRPQATTADGRKIPAMDFTEPKKRMQAQLTQLADIIKSNQELTALLTKGPDGSWVPNLPGVETAQPARFWNTAPAATVAPQATPFFRTPTATMTNAPAVAPPVTNATTGRFFNSPATNAPALNRFVYVPGQGLVPR